MNRYAVALIASCTSLVATGASAQDAIMALNPTTMIGYAGTTAGNAYKPRDFGPRLSRTRAQPRTSSVNAAQIAARTSYRPDPAVRRQVYLRAVAGFQKASPEDAAKLRVQLANGRLRSGVASYMGRYGMSANNVIDTTTLYLAAAWFASRASAGDPSPAQMSGLRRQVALTYAGMPQVLGASNAAKQELAEGNIIQASLASTLANQAARDPKIAGAVRAAVTRAVADMYHLDLTRLNLTGGGFR